MEKITSTAIRVQSEPLRQSFGFKGGSLTQLWQVHCSITTDRGSFATGQSVQSVLWSDSTVFAQRGQYLGNEMMYRLTAFALDTLRGMPLEPPPLMLRKLLPPVLEYGKQITERPNLRTTFALNALTGIDWALWKLYRLHMGNPGFEELTIPYSHCPPHRQTALGGIPLVSYNTTEDQLRQLAAQGYYLYKIKIGSNPGGRNDPDEMLCWDIDRLLQIHRILGAVQTPWTECGHPVYYLDANGRYDSIDRISRLLEAAEKCGALSRILLLEEPFAEDNLQDVRSLPVRVAGDESAHSAKDAAMLIDQYGFRAMALKPIAKTVSVTLDVLRVAQERNVPCFCADLTCNPTMVELNKRFAAGLAPLPGLKTGVFETNGGQNYRNWDAMCRCCPAWGTEWFSFQNGVYTLTEDYYSCDGNIWEET